MIEALFKDIKNKKFYQFDFSKLKFEQISIEPIGIKIVGHDYGSFFKTELLKIYLTKFQLFSLGIYILSSLFENKIKKMNFVNLDNSKFIIKKFIFDPTNDKNDVEFRNEYNLFDWYFFEVDQYPYKNIQNHSLFVKLYLENEFGFCINEQDWKSRDLLKLFGEPFALIELSKLFLNISLSNSTLNEFILETPVGMGGVSPGSIELSINILDNDGSVSQ